MPYAQQHYPFENVEYFERNFPAQFIAEGLDQTRGWFYTLMVLSTHLFDKPPFQNLICCGLVLASDGKKMSKRLKNYPDPVETVNKYGADAIRLYLINSPVVRAEPLRFKEEGVLSVVKDVFLPWYNAYRFLVQNALAYQSRHGKFEPCNVEAVACEQGNILDRWVIGATKTLSNFVRKEMDAYRLYTVVPRLVRFIENLTNVYVRFNRKRLKGLKGDEECLAALSSLFHVLFTVCKIMAPFTPFFVETMYRNLRRALPAGHPDARLESVHFCMLPDPVEENDVDRKLQESVDKMMTVIEFGRTIRAKRNRPTRTPLGEIIVVHPDDAVLSDMQGVLSTYLREELNVRELRVCSDPMQYCTLRAEPNWQVLGKRLGKAMGPVGGAIKKLDTDAVQSLVRDGRAPLASGQEILLEDVKILRDFKLPEGVSPDDMDALSDGDLIVMLDLKEDESLLAAGAAREFASRVQRMRKIAGLEPTDDIEIFYRPDESSAKLVDVVSSEAVVIETLRRMPHTYDKLPAHLTVLGSETCELTNGWKFDLTITLTGVVPNSPALLEAANGNDAARLAMETWLCGLRPDKIEDRMDGDSLLTPVIEGLGSLSLKKGQHFSLSP